MLTNNIKKYLTYQTDPILVNTSAHFLFHHSFRNMKYLLMHTVHIEKKENSHDTSKFIDHTDNHPFVEGRKNFLLNHPSGWTNGWTVLPRSVSNWISCICSFVCSVRANTALDTIQTTCLHNTNLWNVEGLKSWNFSFASPT